MLKKINKLDISFLISELIYCYSRVLADNIFQTIVVKNIEIDKSIV